MQSDAHTIDALADCNNGDHAAHNYNSIDVQIAKASGVYVWDVHGKRYTDCFSAASAVNVGHCHPRIVEAVSRQMHELNVTSRVFANNSTDSFIDRMATTFKYEKVCPLTTGGDATEAAIKLARSWGRRVKGIPDGTVPLILSTADCFHGRSIGAVSMTTDAKARDGFGPFVPGIGSVCPFNNRVIRFGCAKDLKEALNQHGQQTVAFIYEPVQGDAAAVVPPSDYLKQCRELCTKHNVLMIADEVQTGLGRTGHMVASLGLFNVRPDILLLGKSLSGGVVPTSVVMASEAVMAGFPPGSHGSSFGGSPLASIAPMACLDVIEEEGLCENARIMGAYFKEQLYSKLIDAWDIVGRFKDHSVLVKPNADGDALRILPPLCITRDQIDECMAHIEQALLSYCGKAS